MENYRQEFQEGLEFLNRYDNLLQSLTLSKQNAGSNVYTEGTNSFSDGTQQPGEGISEPSSESPA